MAKWGNSPEWHMYNICHSTHKCFLSNYFFYYGTLPRKYMALLRNTCHWSDIRDETYGYFVAVTFSMHDTYAYAHGESCIVRNHDMNTINVMKWLCVFKRNVEFQHHLPQQRTSFMHERIWISISTRWQNTFSAATNLLTRLSTDRKYTIL